MNDLINSTKTYFKGVKTEWSKITWPEKNTIIYETVSVLVIVFAFTIFIYIVDLLFKGLLSLLK